MVLRSDNLTELLRVLVCSIDYMRRLGFHAHPSAILRATQSGHPNTRRVRSYPVALGKMTVTIEIKKVSAGTEGNITQEGVPDGLPRSSLLGCGQRAF